MIHPISSTFAVAAPEAKFAGGPVTQPPFAKGDTVLISPKARATAAAADVDHDGDGH